MRNGCFGCRARSSACTQVKRGQLPTLAVRLGLFGDCAGPWLLVCFSSYVAAHAHAWEALMAGLLMSPTCSHKPLCTDAAATKASLEVSVRTTKPTDLYHHVLACSQAEIHELLLQFAEAGATVVRLKGGDPYVFGRYVLIMVAAERSMCGRGFVLACDGDCQRQHTTAAMAQCFGSAVLRMWSTTVSTPLDSKHCLQACADARCCYRCCCYHCCYCCCAC